MAKGDLALTEEQRNRSRGRVQGRRDTARALPPSSEAFRLVYDTVSARRGGYDLLMWQTPALGMTAQAFLLTIALGPDTRQTARLIASLLALVVSVISMQLMSKHRFHERIDSEFLVRLEEEHGLTPVMGIAPHARPDARAKYLEELTGQSTVAAAGVGAWLRRKVKWGWPGRQWRRSSYQIWKWGLGLFAITDVAIVVLVLADSGVFSR